MREVISRRYARSLYDVCDERELDVVSQACRCVGEACCVPEFRSAMCSPAVSRYKRLAFIAHVAGFGTDSDVGYGVSSKIMNFFSLILDSGRVFLLPFIAEEIDSLRHAGMNTYSCTVHSGCPMDNESLGELKCVLERKLGATLSIAQSLDPSLDGIKVSVPGLNVEILFCRDVFMNNLRKHVLMVI